METEVKIFLDSSDAISEEQLLDAAFIRDLANSARELENRLVAKKSYLKFSEVMYLCLDFTLYQKHYDTNSFV